MHFNILLAGILPSFVVEPSPVHAAQNRIISPFLFRIQDGKAQMNESDRPIRYPPQRAYGIIKTVPIIFLIRAVDPLFYGIDQRPFPRDPVINNDIYIFWTFTQKLCYSISIYILKTEHYPVYPLQILTTCLILRRIVFDLKYLTPFLKICPPLSILLLLDTMAIEIIRMQELTEMNLAEKVNRGVIFSLPALF